MEITVNTQLIAILVSVISIGVIILIAIIVAHIALVRRTGKLPTRDEFNALSGKVSDLEVAVATAVAALNGRIDTVDSRIDAMNDQFDVVNARIDAVIDAVKSQFDAVNARIDALPTQESLNLVNARIDAVIDAVKGQFDAVNARIDALPTQESLDAAIRASEARIIKALINHRHPEPSGSPVFTEPL